MKNKFVLIACVGLSLTMVGYALFIFDTVTSSMNKSLNVHKCIFTKAGDNKLSYREISDSCDKIK